ncbi:CAAX geranylgeranyltransferase alpha subunit [Dispira parvispora]|uniref:Protein farnesyltransferase/geranylgeranyltransferase type-1 subunit alpha n=1 Tax=Dispira parvispora TaxID=1520584 RepID=A0A9W8E621_9FUNG|nr:CAAX geranylgeranyltransferase alpha subunit [Dispira parvispora]
MLPIIDAEAMGYFRAIMRSNEKSARALELTEEIIWLNPGHYTAWAYRLDILKALKLDLHQELEFLNEFALCNPKTYQLWHHRREIITLLGDPQGEFEFLESVFKEDGKNFHAWAYRQWLLVAFDLWNGELEFIEKILEVDVRNNSVWNQRFFVVTRASTIALDQPTLARELEFAWSKILLAPGNESSWVYYRGLLEQFGTTDEWLAVEAQLKNATKEDNITPEDNGELLKEPQPSLTGSRFYWEMLVDVHTYKIQHTDKVIAVLNGTITTPDLTKQSRDEVQRLCAHLEELDPVRKAYWTYRTDQLSVT